MHSTTSGTLAFSKFGMRGALAIALALLAACGPGPDGGEEVAGSVLDGPADPGGADEPSQFASGESGVTAITNTCTATVCDVTAFSGTADERIAKAIAAARLTAHKTVYFPDGTYVLSKSIEINTLDAVLTLRGQSRSGVRLVSAPIIYSAPQACFGPIFQIDRAGGFNLLSVKLQSFTLDLTRNLSHPIYLSAGCSGGGHGVRVGNGWRSGSLTLERLNILSPTGYGIGVQNSGTGDIAANDLVISNVTVQNAGMDGFDSKNPPGSVNRRLTIRNMRVTEIGFNDEASAAGIDIRYNDFKLSGISIITAATRSNPRGLATNTGIRIRGDGTSFGTIENVYVKGTWHPIFFEGKYPLINTNVTVRSVIVKNFSGTGVYVRGRDHVIERGCSFTSLPMRVRLARCEKGESRRSLAAGDRQVRRIRVSGAAWPSTPAGQLFRAAQSRTSSRF